MRYTEKQLQKQRSSETVIQTEKQRKIEEPRERKKTDDQRKETTRDIYKNRQYSPSNTTLIADCRLVLKTTGQNVSVRMALSGHKPAPHYNSCFVRPQPFPCAMIQNSYPGPVSCYHWYLTGNAKQNATRLLAERNFSYTLIYFLIGPLKYRVLPFREFFLCVCLGLHTDLFMCSYWVYIYNDWFYGTVYMGTYKPTYT